jgi:hypothetical protein
MYLPKEIFRRICSIPKEYILSGGAAPHEGDVSSKESIFKKKYISLKDKAILQFSGFLEYATKITDF